MDVSADLGSTFLKVEDIRNDPRQVRIKNCQVGQFERLDFDFDDGGQALAYQYVEADMNRNLASEDFEEILRSAEPRLIVRVEPANDRTHGLTPFIREIDPGWDEVISEGYDPIYSPLGCPVYWRIVTRATEQLYLSTFLATREVVLKGGGRKGLAYRNRDTGMTPARLETLCSPKVQGAFSTSQSN